MIVLTATRIRFTSIMTGLIKTFQASRLKQIIRKASLVPNVFPQIMV